MFHLQQENIDDTVDGFIVLDTDNKWDADSKVMKNLADPVNAQDAVTKTWAETSMTSTLAQCMDIYDQFDDRYLGSKASDPALDNDGDALLTGALYWNTTSNMLNVYDGAVWLNTTVSPTSYYNKTEIDALAAAAPHRNMLRNGLLNIWQRGTSFVSVGGGDRTADGWFFGFSASPARFTAQQSTELPPGSSGNSLHIDCTIADNSVAAGDIWYMAQRVEGPDVEHLRFGTSAAKAVSLSFWIRSPRSGTHSGALINSAKNRCYTFEYTIAVGGTWQYVTIENIPGDTSGTWLTDPGAMGLELRFGLMVGSTFAQAAGSWGTTNAVGTVNQTNLLDDVSRDTYFKDIQLEVGATANPIEARNRTEELARCQRYYCKSYQYSTTPGASTATGAQAFTAPRNIAEAYISPTAFPVTMMPGGTAQTWGTSGTANELSGLDSASLTIASLTFNDRGIRVVTATTTMLSPNRYQFHWAIEAEL